MCGFFLVTTVIFCYRKNNGWGFQGRLGHPLWSQYWSFTYSPRSRVTRVAANHPNKDWRRKHPQDPIDSVFFLGGWEGWKDGRGWQAFFCFWLNWVDCFLFSIWKVSRFGLVNWIEKLLGGSGMVRTRSGSDSSQQRTRKQKQIRKSSVSRFKFRRCCGAAWTCQKIKPVCMSCIMSYLKKMTSGKRTKPY